MYFLPNCGEPRDWGSRLFWLRGGRQQEFHWVRFLILRREWRQLGVVGGDFGAQELQAFPVNSYEEESPDKIMTRVGWDQAALLPTGEPDAESVGDMMYTALIWRIMMR